MMEGRRTQKRRESPIRDIIGDRGVACEVIVGLVFESLI